MSTGRKLVSDVRDDGKYYIYRYILLEIIYGKEMEVTDEYGKIISQFDKRNA